MRLILAIALIFTANLAYADFIPPISEAGAPSESLPPIEEQIKAYLAQQINNNIPGRIEIEVRPSHSSLQQCTQPLQLTSHRSSNGQWMGNIMVQAYCPGTPSWSTYVPAKIKIFQPAVVVTRALTPGARLGENELALQEVDISEQKAGTSDHMEDFIGKQLKYTLNAGQVVTLHDIKSPLIIHKQELVNVVAKVNQLAVAINAEALDDGALGELIHIKNLQSNRIIQGIVVGPQSVEIPQTP